MDNGAVIAFRVTLCIIILATVITLGTVIEKQKKNTEFIESLDIQCVAWSSEDGDIVHRDVLYASILAIHMHGTINTTKDGEVVHYIEEVRKTGYGGWSVTHWNKVDCRCVVEPCVCWVFERIEYNNCVQYALVMNVEQDTEKLPFLKFNMSSIPSGVAIDVSTWNIIKEVN